MSSAGLGRLFNRLASTTKLQLIATRPASLRTSFRSSTFGPSPLTAYRTVATTGKAKAKATATKAKPSGRAATTTKKATTKKAALKKPAAKTKKTAVRKAASKKKAAPKKKKAAPKKKVAAKPKKKVLTDEQKEAKKAKAKLLKFRSTKQEMLKQALAPPTKKPDINFSGYSLFLSQSMSGHNLKDSKDTFTSEIAKKWSALPEAEKQRYSELAKVKKDDSRDAYRAFIESHKPNDIVKANAARRWLRAQGVRGNHLPLVDHRLPKHPITAFFHFMGELREKGDMSGSNVRDMSRAAGEKWKALSDDEKKPYLDLAAASKQKYDAQKAAVFGA